MKKQSKNILKILGVILAIVGVYLIATSGVLQTQYMGTASALPSITCAVDHYGETSGPIGFEPQVSYVQDPVPGNPPPYNNCFVDSLAKLNADRFGADEGQLRYDLTTCMQDKGYDPVKNGVPATAKGVNDMLDCKKKAMAATGVNERFGGGGVGKPGNPVPTESPFKNNCPPVGSTIIGLFGGRPPNPGHAASCVVLLCNPKNGHATLDCTDSSASSGGAHNYQVDVGPSGNQIVNPAGSSLDGGQCWGFITVNG